MHGELIYRHPGGGGERRVPGNAVPEDENTVRWEFHDRGLSNGEVRELIDALEQVRSQGEVVRLSYIPGSPPLEEVESGPQISDEHSRPIEYEIVELDREEARVRLRQMGGS